LRPFLVLLDELITSVITSSNPSQLTVSRGCFISREYYKSFLNSASPALAKANHFLALAVGVQRSAARAFKVQAVAKLTRSSVLHIGVCGPGKPTLDKCKG
jgi:hypothetical protein